MLCFFHQVSFDLNNFAPAPCPVMHDACSRCVFQMLSVQAFDVNTVYHKTVRASAITLIEFVEEGLNYGPRRKRIASVRKTLHSSCRGTL